MNTFVLETTSQGDVPIDVYQKMANDRHIFIYNEITDELATHIVSTLLLKDNENSSGKITLFINSEGGDIRNILMIYDTIKMIRSPVETICIGTAFDGAALLLSAGTLGMRFATKNAKISISCLVHDWTKQTDLSGAEGILKLAIVDNKSIMKIIAKCTNKNIKKVSQDFSKRVFFNAKQTLNYNIIDNII